MTRTGTSSETLPAPERASRVLGPEAGPGRASLASRLAPWLFWLAALGIGLAAIQTIMHLLDRTDARRRMQLVLAEINAEAGHLRLAEVLAELNTDGDGDFAASLAAEEEELSQTLSRLLDLDPDGDAAYTVDEAAEQYIRNAREHLERLRTDEVASWQWEHERSGPSYEVLQEATTRAAIFYSAQASRGFRHVRWSAALAIGSEALLIGLLVGLSSHSRHVAERKLHVERVSHAARFEALVQNSADVIALLDERGVIRYLSPSAERVLGYRNEEAVGESSLSFLDADGHERVRDLLQEVVMGRRDVLGLELAAHHADGSLRWIEVSARNLLSDPNVGGIVVNYRDVTAARTLREELRHRALHDPLTGLANRDLFGLLVEKAVSKARRNVTPVSVLYIDLDGFKAVNDGLGHEAGDELLLGVAGRLRETLREHETAARLGGDEFAVLLESAGMEAATTAAARILNSLKEPFLLAAGEGSIGASIGVAVGEAGAQTPEELLRRADVAMYVAKARGRGRLQVFEPGMSVLAMRTARTVADLERALARGELVLHYQPVIHLHTGRLVGVEALVRWKLPGSGDLLPPSEFLSMAEESGLSVPLGRWVLRKACEQVRRWQDEYPTDPPLLLHLNLAAGQLVDVDLIADLSAALRETRFPPSSLVVEVSEEVLVEHAASARARFRALRGLGVLLAIDDFGSGSSCVSSLRGFSVDLVKIESRFIDRIAVGGSASRLALQIIERARQLSPQTVAEGVEQGEQISEAAAAGCELAQGFSLARPMGAADLEHLLRSAASGPRSSDGEGATAFG